MPVLARIYSLGCNGEYDELEITHIYDDDAEFINENDLILSIE